MGLRDDIRLKLDATEAFDLRLFIPVFAPFPKGVVLLHFLPTQEWPPQDQLTFTDPRVLGIYLEGYAGAFPMLEFSSFVKGVATTALLVKPEEYAHVRMMVDSLVQAMLEFGGDMPPRPALPKHLETDCLTAISAVVNDTETFNWRRMLSFVFGVYWLLGFLVESKPSKLQQDGLDYLTEMAVRHAKLGTLPS